MARTVTHAKLETRSARARLKPGRQAHWRTLLTGRAHLGYRRRPEAPEGAWLLRRYVDGKYQVEALGAADDGIPADGDRVLSFEQAQAKALATIDAPKAKRDRITVRDAMADYIGHKAAQGQPTTDLKSRTNAHLLPALGDKVVSELTAERLRRWIADLASSPAMKRTRRGAAQQYKADPDGEEAVLLPRGGGAFVAEVDGNLVCLKQGGGIVDLHWQGKFRGPDFAPMPFKIETGTTERLKDSKGRAIWTVTARPSANKASRVRELSPSR